MFVFVDKYQKQCDQSGACSVGQSSEILQAVIAKCVTFTIHLVILRNANIFSNWRRTCHVSWVKTRYLQGKQPLWTLDSHVIRSCTLKPRQICCATRQETNTFFAVFFPTLELGGITKHFVTSPTGKQWVLFALGLGLASGTIAEGPGETKLTASLVTFLSLRFTLLILTDQEHNQVTQTYQMLDWTFFQLFWGPQEEVTTSSQ